jgi:hypothetical protein
MLSVMLLLFGIFRSQSEPVSTEAVGPLVTSSSDTIFLRGKVEKHHFSGLAFVVRSLFNEPVRPSSSGKMDKLTQPVHYCPETHLLRVLSVDWSTGWWAYPTGWR